MIKFTGLVIQCSDNRRMFFDKDKDGNRLSTQTEHRQTAITLLCDTEVGKRVIVVKGWDLSNNFKVPQQGKEWTTPEVVEYSSRFKTVPEASIEG